ncbi:MAG TPA: DUF4214 domain-containing protein [Rhizomicrobium sp.]
MARSARQSTKAAARHPHRDAARLAGELYGKILNRDADPGGYRYVLYCLESGSKSVQQLVLDFIASDEFIDSFASREPAHTASLVNKLLLGESRQSDTEMQMACRRFVRLGLQQYAEEIVLSQEYQQTTGPDGVPGMGH